MSDITHLLAIMDRLVGAGNSVIMIEHNLDVIRNADWIIDLGPEGGSKGGEVVFEGTDGAGEKQAVSDGTVPATVSGGHVPFLWWRVDAIERVPARTAAQTREEKPLPSLPYMLLRLFGRFQGRFVDGF
jgi:hypothetical protein